MNTFRKRLLSGELLVGSWIQTGSPAAAEILAESGFDWIAADMEHSSIAIDEFTAIARGIYGRGVITAARVRENDTLAIRQVLDMGAECVIIPMVNNAEEAERAVRSAKYPPAGVRGFGYARMNNWGRDFAEYAANANEDIAVIVMIESKEAVDNIEEIVSVEGVDGVFIGPYDMSGSYGIPGQTSDPIITEACSRVAKACKRHGKVAGQHIVLPTSENVSRALSEGYSFIALGGDIIFVRRAAEEAMELLKK
ncbi:MAG: 2,4-dihydroxyhept-2-ene-1,7-dioic acid aldolase [Clostridia bacterium]|nr:2,4-dihydroxyhept-2-ene-1,7-dioic acid aldolase [Clostridia bacterium]